jgi:hypothetical protein
LQGKEEAWKCKFALTELLVVNCGVLLESLTQSPMKVLALLLMQDRNSLLKVESVGLEVRGAPRSMQIAIR